MSFNHLEIEEKWQKYWKNHETFKTTEDTNKDNFYILDMFPYPSGQGLHVGHPLGYTATDILARMKRAQDYNVLHPMGDRKSTRLNSSHVAISYAVFCLKKK